MSNFSFTSPPASFSSCFDSMLGFPRSSQQSAFLWPYFHNDYISLYIIYFIGKIFVSFSLLLLHHSSWVSFDLLVPSETFLCVSTHLFSSTACTFLLIFFLTHLQINLRFFCLSLLDQPTTLAYSFGKPAKTCVITYSSSMV